MTDRRFPVLWQGPRVYQDELAELGCPRDVPWELVAPHDNQALTNHSQTLDRLADRGGLSPQELIAVLTDNPLRETQGLSNTVAVAILLRAIKELHVANKPVIETNDENLDRPWAWLVRVPCTYHNELGNPYPGCSELRVSLLNYEGAADPTEPSISLRGLLPFGPLSKSSATESLGGYVLTAQDAHALAAALVRAADHSLGKGER